VVPEASPNFMPGLWARVEARESSRNIFGRMARALVTAALAASVVIGLLVSFEEANQPLTGTYIEAVAADRVSTLEPFPPGKNLGVGVPVETPMPRSKINAALYLTLVFGSGALVGVVSHRLYETTSVNANTTAPRSMDEFRRRYFEQMRKWGVNDQQIERIREVLDEAKDKYDDLHAKEKPMRDQIQREQVESVRAVLTDSQRAEYDKWRGERERQRARKNAPPATH